MSQLLWRAPRRSGALRSLTVLLILSSLLFAGCGLFGGDDEPEPEVVERPATASQPADIADADSDDSQPTDQQEQPAEAVTVTTSPSDEQTQQQAASESDAEQEEAEAQDQEQADPTIYVVQAGDTLAQIANRLGVRIDDLITLNGIQNPDLLVVGQELQIPQPDPPPSGSSDDSDADSEEEDAEQEQAAEEQAAAQESQLEPPSVELPTVAVPAATPTRVSYSQFPQPGPDVVSDVIPDPPANFLQYGAAALPWLHGIYEIEPMIELFKAWPMPALAVGNDRIVLFDARNAREFSVSIVYTNPNSFGAAVPYSNLVVYDPVPSDLSKYRIAYDHAQAYAREVQGIQQITDADMNGDEWRDLTFREITCGGEGCISSFYILVATDDGYRTVTGTDAQIRDVSAIALEDRTGDGIPELVVEGFAADEAEAGRYSFVFVVRGDDLLESLRVALDDDSDEG